MNINGQIINTEEELAAAIIGMDETSKVTLTNIFRGIPNEPPVLSQQEKDLEKYKKRAAVKDAIMAEMASENMARVRAGIWTVAELISLTQDEGLKGVLDDMMTLSFELAQAKVMALTNPLITSEIKAGWVSKLQANLFNS